jgi:hypothetical protein
MRRWKLPDGCEDDTMRCFGRACAEKELISPEFFPDLRGDDDLAMACDYSGEHKESDYQVVTYLLADRPGIMDRWEGERLAIRRKHLADGRRHAFKNLSDAQRQKALGPFLAASSRINGIICCVAFDKSLAGSDLGYQFEAAKELKPLVRAKLAKIAVFGATLVGGLSRAGQNLNWITDDDEIVSNETAQQATTGCVGAMLHRCCTHGLSDVSMGIAGKFDDGLRAEDLCAIPDLVGGAVAEHLNSLDKDTIPRKTSIVTPSAKRLSTKTQLLMAWFASLAGPLKRMLVLARENPGGGVLLSFADPEILREEPSQRTIWTPPDKGWRRSLGGW